MKKKIVSALAGLLVIVFLSVLAGCPTTEKSGKKGKGHAKGQNRQSTTIVIERVD